MDVVARSFQLITRRVAQPEPSFTIFEDPRDDNKENLDPLASLKLAEKTEPVKSKLVMKLKKDLLKKSLEVSCFIFSGILQEFRAEQWEFDNTERQLVCKKLNFDTE